MAFLSAIRWLTPPANFDAALRASTLRGAGRELRSGLSRPLDQLPKPDFVRAWFAVAYAFPGLHPDGYEDAGSGRPRVIVSKNADFSHRMMMATLPPWVVHLWFGILRRRDFHALLTRLWPRIETLLPGHKLVNGMPIESER